MQNYRKITLKKHIYLEGLTPDCSFHLSFSLQLEIHRFLPFGIMAGLALGAALLCMTLPETHNKPTIENLKYDRDDQLINEKDEMTTFKKDEGTEIPVTALLEQSCNI